jgi:uncharacterized membrane protein
VTTLADTSPTTAERAESGWRARASSALLTARRHRAHMIGLGVIMLVYGAIYFVYLMTRESTLNSGLLDVGIYDQAISSLAHFHGPDSPVVALPSLGSPGKSQFSDHFTPLLVVFVPLYWIHNGPSSLYFGTAVLAVLPVVPMWIFTRRMANTWTAYFVVLAYGASWPMQMALWFAFHEVFLALPILAWMIERAQAGRIRQAALISLLLLGVKDDMGFVVAAFGVYLAAKDLSPLRWHEFWRELRKPRRYWLLLMVPIGFGMVELVGNVIIPHFGGAAGRDFTYTDFGPTTGAAVKQMVTHPTQVITDLFSPPVKWQTLQWLLWPLLLLPLLSPLSILAVPLVVERFLSDNVLYWGMPYHYNAFLLPILFLAGVDGAVRLARWIGLGLDGVRVGRLGFLGTMRAPTVRTWVQVIFGLYVLIFSWATVERYPMWHMTQASFWQSNTPTVNAAKTAAAHVPAGVTVAAATQIGTHLLSKDKVIMWSTPGDRGYPETPWVLADVQRPSYPFLTVDDQKADVARMISEGYQVVFEDYGWVVLHRA